MTYLTFNANPMLLKNIVKVNLMYKMRLLYFYIWLIPLKNESFKPVSNIRTKVTRFHHSAYRNSCYCKLYDLTNYKPIVTLKGDHREVVTLFYWYYVTKTGPVF